MMIHFPLSYFPSSASSLGLSQDYRIMILSIFPVENGNQTFLFHFSCDIPAAPRSAKRGRELMSERQC
jgi:hypothetical protein